MAKRLVGYIALWLFVFFSATYCSAKVDPVSLQERVKASDVILTGPIIKSYDTGIIKEAGVQRWIAECQVTEVLRGKIDEPIIKISFMQIPNQKPQPVHLEEQKKYLLFLTNLYELSNHYHGALILEGELRLYDDEIAPEYSAVQVMTPEKTIARVKEIIRNTQK